MAHFKIKEFNYITYGNTEATFDVAYCIDTFKFEGEDVIDKQIIDNTIYRTTFFAENYENNSMSEKYNSNTGALYNITNKYMLHNLYDIHSVRLRTSIPKKNDEMNRTTDSYNDIWCPMISSNFLNICQYGSYAFGLTETMTDNPLILSAILDVQNDDIYYYQLSSLHMPIYLYSTQDYSQIANNVSTLFMPEKCLNNIKKNYIIEIPENGIQNFYESGNIFGNIVYCKNSYDTSYSMNVDGDLSINNCRDYCGLDKCCGELFLKYRDNMNYYSTNSTVDNTYDITHYEMEEQKTTRQYTYQHIEKIKSINRFAYENSHKSNMYSIELNNIGVNTNAFIGDDVKEKLRQEIAHNVRNLAELICPANTQLFNVYFTGL